MKAVILESALNPDWLEKSRSALAAIGLDVQTVKSLDDIKEAPNCLVLVNHYFMEAALRFAHANSPATTVILFTALRKTGLYGQVRVFHKSEARDLEELFRRQLGLATPAV